MWWLSGGDTHLGILTNGVVDGEKIGEDETELLVGEVSHGIGGGGGGSPDEGNKQETLVDWPRQ